MFSVFTEIMPLLFYLHETGTMTPRNYMSPIWKEFEQTVEIIPIIIHKDSPFRKGIGSAETR